MIIEASAYFDLGCALQDAQRHQEALSAFEQAQAIDPNLPFVQHRIAAQHLSLGDYATTISLLEAIVQKNPRDVSAWRDICVSAHFLRQWDKSLAAGERAFAINPNHPQVLLSYGIILSEFRAFKRARRLMERAVALDPENDFMRSALSLEQLADGDLLDGWKNAAAWRWRRPKQFSEAVNSLGPGWGGENLTNKNLLIWPEFWQGHGDVILFLRYADKLAERAKRENGLIVFCCFDPLRTLFGRSLARHCNELVFASFSKGNPLQPQHFLGRKVVQTSLLSLPPLLGDTIPDKFPYLTPDPFKVDLWRKRLSSDKNLKIGFSWTGRADHLRNNLRSYPVLDLVARLKDIPNLSFYSLQRSAPDEVEAALRLNKPDQTQTAKAAGMIDFTSELASFDDTAALISNLDLVIAMDGVIAHLAGALNIPTWVLVDVNPPWMWGRYGPQTVWYRSATIYRQHRMHRWEEVFAEVEASIVGVLRFQ